MRAWTARHIILHWCAWPALLGIAIGGFWYWLTRYARGVRVKVSGPASFVRRRDLTALGLCLRFVIGPPLLLTLVARTHGL